MNAIYFSRIQQFSCYYLHIVCMKMLLTLLQVVIALVVVPRPQQHLLSRCWVRMTGFCTRGTCWSPHMHSAERFRKRWDYNWCFILCMHSTVLYMCYVYMHCISKYIHIVLTITMLYNTLCSVLRCCFLNLLWATTPHNRNERHIRDFCHGMGTCLCDEYHLSG